MDKEPTHLNALEARFGRQVVRRAAALAPAGQPDEP
jgi:hypothetical protein